MRNVFLLLLILATGACSTLVSQRVHHAERLAGEGGLRPLAFSGELPLAGYARVGSGPLWVFIEGDGLAWISPTQPSLNPTPLDPVALRLAAIDPAENVLYLARPGQYLSAKVPGKYWLGARFAPLVVSTVQAAVEQHARLSGADQVVLVGYSGGGALAAMVAARMSGGADLHVAGLVTVAGNLDHVAWTERLGLSPLAESLNAADVAAQLVSVPQLHLVGTLDNQVPAAVLESFLRRVADDRCVVIHRVRLGHGGPWEDAWREARSQPLRCGGDQ